MAIERIEKVRGHWRAVTVWDESGGRNSIQFCFEQCIFCPFQTQPGNVTSRTEQMNEHERAHPIEHQAREFYKFREGLHYTAMDLCHYHGLQAFQWNDSEELHTHFERFLNARQFAGVTWAGYIRGLFGAVEEWKSVMVALN